MNNWLRSPVIVAVILTLASLSIVFIRNEVLSQPAQELPLMVAESSEYLQMAQGDSSHVIAPFTKRALYPFLSRCFSNVTGIALRPTFLILDIASFVFLSFYIARIFMFFGLSPWVSTFFILTPFSISRLELGYLPDLLHVALTALFFLLLLQKRPLPALVVLAICFTVRENTLVMCLMVIILAWTRRDRFLAFGAGIVTVFGMAFGSWCVRSGQPNIHQLPDFLYLALKLPHQFLKNVLGLRIWSNTLPFGDVYAKWTLPHPIGAVREIGICYPEWNSPFFTFITLLTLFGSGPLLIYLARHLKLASARHPLPIQLAAVYGILSFFIGTSIGDWIDRLIGYGWPLFWIVLPYVLSPAMRTEARLNLRISLISITAIAWIPSLFSYDRLTPFPQVILMLALIVAAYGITLRQHSRWRRTHENEPAPST